MCSFRKRSAIAQVGAKQHSVSSRTCIWNSTPTGAGALITSLDPPGVDVLVVAGDLATVDYLAAGLRDLCDRFAHVVYVLGNHEFYGTSFAEVRAEMALLSSRHANRHVLDGRVLLQLLMQEGGNFWHAGHGGARTRSVPARTRVGCGTKVRYVLDVL